MCKPVSKTNDYRRWAEQPFISGSVTPGTRTGVRRFESLTCAHCGSVTICGGTKLHNATARGRRFFCDIECANEYKKWHNRTEEYKSLPSIAAEYERRREKRNKNETARNARRKPRRGCGSKVRIICCIYCGIAHRRTWATRRSCGGAQCRAIATVLAKPMYGSRMHSRQLRSRCVRGVVDYREPITLLDLAKQYKWRCQLCGCKCIKSTGRNEPNEITIDHIIPTAKGGWHIRSNVQLLCRQCNSRKTDTVVGGSQLMLRL